MEDPKECRDDDDGDDDDNHDESRSEIDSPSSNALEGSGGVTGVGGGDGGQSSGGGAGEGNEGRPRGAGRRDARGSSGAEGKGGSQAVSSSGGGKRAASKSKASTSSAIKPSPAKVPNTNLQRKIAGRIADGKRALYYKHASGRELAASFMDSTGTILQETSQQIQEISNAMRFLQGNLWELAATGATPWQRVPNNVHIPPDVYEKYNHVQPHAG